MTATDAELVRPTLDALGCRARVVSVTPLEAFENSVFRVETSDGASVVRISNRGEKTYREVRAELAFVEFLATAGVKVARPLGEAVDLGGPVGAWFEYVPGEQASTTRRLDPRIAVQLGRVMGQMHVAARGFRSDTAGDRPHWWAGESFRLDYLAGVADHEMVSDVQQFTDEVRRAASGELLVHGDLGLGNVIIGSALHVIDFDDSCRAEAEYDLAVLLVRLFAHEDASRADVDRIVPLLVSGYRSSCGDRLDVCQIERYARILLLQAAVAACRKPGCPGLSAPDAVSRVWTAISGARAMPPVLARAVERVANAL